MPKIDSKTVPAFTELWKEFTEFWGSHNFSNLFHDMMIFAKPAEGITITTKF